MSTSVNSNSAIPSALVEDGQAFYESNLKAALEPDHSGEFVAIEPLAARYFLGQTATAALVAARNAMPESQFYLTRIGRGFAHKIISATYPAVLKRGGDGKESGGKPAFPTQS